jgi:SAM-dependent methyltransferase
MKALDRFLRAWRSRVALAAAPAGMGAVLDVGCGDGYLLGKLAASRRDGLDPTLAAERREAGLRLAAGYFPADLEKLGFSGPYDAIFSLAVFEHLGEAELAAARAALPALLRPGGRLIVTVPHPFVDRILDFLLALRLIDGQAVHEHHGFEPADLGALASERLRLVRRSAFQFGLNNLFVFERTPEPCSSPS